LQFLKKFGENIFSYVNAVLFCEVCGVKVSSEKNTNVQQHNITRRKKHTQKLNLRNQQEKSKS